MKFSRRVVLVYSLIVLVPLVFLLLVITRLNGKEEYNILYEDCEKQCLLNSEHISSVGESFELIKKMVDANSKLLLYLVLPEASSEDYVIDTVVSESSVIEQLLSVMPNIYAVRFFTNNPSIPERWPVFINVNRTDVASLKSFEFDYVADYMGNQESLMAPSFVATRPVTYNAREAGYLQVAVKMEEAFPFLFKKPDRFQNDYILSKNDDGEWNPVENAKIVSYHGQIPEVVLEKIRNTKKVDSEIDVRSGSFSFRKKGQRIFVTWNEIPKMNLISIHTCSTEIINRNIRHLVEIMFLVILFSLALFYSLIHFASHRLMSGVFSVMEGMKKVKNGDFSVRIPVTAKDEVGETQAVFNSMTEQLTSQIEQIKNEQSLIADTEMKAMQNQINAHFLYNVLETIRMQAELADQDDISESITVLGKMMRYCLRWRIHRVTLEQEVEYVRSYVYILNIRNDYVISLQVEIPEEFASVEIPKMILQPLIENAFTHAIEPMGQDAVVRITAEKKGDCLELSVQDFGPGMDEETLEKINNYLADDTYERDSKGSIGLKNIQQRLTMFYGAGYRVKIRSEKGKGTIITVPIPGVK
ncbi:MAG: sensor histidine kinase [Treponema sp.]|nr:sensor histidine kinase [Treponema sp.]